MSALKFGMDIIVFGLGVERVPPLQGFSLSIDVNTMILLSALFYDFFAWVGAVPLQDLFIFIT